MTTKQTARLLRSLERDYAAAIRAEEEAPSMTAAWRLASASERCLRRLQAVQAGQPLPEPRTARNRARGGLAALAMIGKAIARGISARAALAKAHAVSALRRAAQLAARAARQALRSALRTIASAICFSTEGTSMTIAAAQLLASTLSHSANGRELRAIIEGDRIAFIGGRSGSHSLDIGCSSPERIAAHWNGYIANQGSN